MCSILQAPADGVEEKQTLDARLEALMRKDEVVLFMKGTRDAPRCGFSRKIVGILNDQRVEFSSFDILSDETVRQGTVHPQSSQTAMPDPLRQPGLKDYNNWPTFPQLVIKGEFVGGLDVVQEMVNSGELQDLLA